MACRCLWILDVKSIKFEDEVCNHIEKVSLLTQDADIKFFNFFSRPRGSAQKYEAGFNAWIKFKTTDVNDAAQVLPPEMFNEFSQDHFQRLSMKRIF